MLVIIYLLFLNWVKFQANSFDWTVENSQVKSTIMLFVVAKNADLQYSFLSATTVK